MKNAEKTIAIEDMQKKDLKVLLEHEYKYMMDKEIRKNAKDVLDRYAEAPAKVKKAELLAAIKSDNRAWTKFNENMNKSHEKKVQEKAKKAEASKKKEQVETSLKLAKKSSPKKEVEKAPTKKAPAKKEKENDSLLKIFPEKITVGDEVLKRISLKSYEDAKKVAESNGGLKIALLTGKDIVDAYEDLYGVPAPKTGFDNDLDMLEVIFFGEENDFFLGVSIFTEAVVRVKGHKATFIKNKEVYEFDSVTPMYFYTTESSEESEEENEEE